jgi:hypothetical protein
VSVHVDDPAVLVPVLALLLGWAGMIAVALPAAGSARALRRRTVSLVIVTAPAGRGWPPARRSPRRRRSTGR